MGFKRLTRDQFLALPDAEKDDYRYAVERAQRRERAVWFWSVGAALIAGAVIWVDDGSMGVATLSALSLWLVFLAIR